MKQSVFIFQLLICSVFILPNFAMAQSNLWTKYEDSGRYKGLGVEANMLLWEKELYELDEKSFREQLKSAPNRFALSSSLILDIPVGNDKFESFEIYEASNFSEDLQDKFPNIRSYIGKGLDNPNKLIRFSLSPYGIHFNLDIDAQENKYIDPYYASQKIYAVYDKSMRENLHTDFVCHVETEVGSELKETSGMVGELNINDSVLRTYRLALACTSQYANYHLSRAGVSSSASIHDKKEAVLAEMNVALTRINSIFERDLAVHLQLVGDNDELIFLDSVQDPYTNHDGYNMLFENQATVDNIIGRPNYDVGHVFSTGGGGVAYLGSVCSNYYKASGVTGLYTPIADPFYVDYVSHEMGHQFGANHTFHSTTSSCGYGNRNLGTAYEPGSGSTIMSYAGICPPHNVQNNSDAYFHLSSIQEIANHIRYASSCAWEDNIANQAPVVNTLTNYYIPKSTPFELIAQATDADGDELTYTWEQMDSRNSTQPPVNTNVYGPLFRSLAPSTNPERIFPNLETILDGQTQNSYEVLPAVGRTLNFSVTVRDNHLNGGASTSKAMKAFVDEISGPFKITSQNGVTNWLIGSTENITWDVAGTDLAPVSASHVSIYLSIDGGQNFDYVLAENIPNNGNYSVLVPNLETETARIKLKADGNIFFDINNSDITISTSMGIQDYDIANFMVYPNPTQGKFSIQFTDDDNNSVQISLYDVQGKRIKHESIDEVSSAAFLLNLDYSDIDTGIYFLEITSGTKTAVKQLIKY